MDAALEGSLNVLQQAEKAGVKKFVVTSSTIALVGDPTVKGTAFRAEHWSPVTKEDALRSNDKIAIYTASKKYAELAVWEWAEAHPHVDVTTILPSIIFGPFPSKWVPFPKPDFDTLSTALMLYNLLFPTGTYLPTVDYAGYIDIRDVARAHVGALDSKPDKNARKRVIITSPHEIGNKQVLDIIKKEHPELERRFITDPVPEFSTRRDIDFERLEEVTGVRKEDFHTLEQTISDSVNDLLRLENEWKRNGYTVTEVPSFH
jgi:nucleoside-diphosphate-sugar epimerase